MSPIYFKRLLLLVFLIIISVFTVAAQETGSKQESDAPKRVIRMSPPELEAGAATRVEPVYPAVARWAGVSGSVSVHGLINHEGEVIDANASGGHAVLRNAAATAARGWKFKPAEADGKPVSVEAILTIKFPTDSVVPAITQS